MTSPDTTTAHHPSRHPLALCGWCLAAVAIEIGLYLSYRGHEARFHFFTHGFLGWAAALLLMSAVAYRTERAAPRPLLWLLGAHLFAMFPDILFSAAGVAHQRWMDIFLFHVSSHFIPGRNTTWLAVFLTALALYLAVLDRTRNGRRAASSPAPT